VLPALDVEFFLVRLFLSTFDGFLATLGLVTFLAIAFSFLAYPQPLLVPQLSQR
jgi:hypothetical protein